MVSSEPLNRGQIIERSDLKKAGPSSPTDEMIVALPESKAPINQLMPGDYLELIATTGSGANATSRVVASSARVIGVFKTGSTFSQSGQQGANILLSVDNPVEAMAISQAETAESIVGIKVSGPSSPAFQGVFSLGGS